MFLLIGLLISTSIICVHATDAFFTDAVADDIRNTTASQAHELFAPFNTWTEAYSTTAHESCTPNFGCAVYIFVDHLTLPGAMPSNNATLQMLPQDTVPVGARFKLHVACYAYDIAGARRNDTIFYSSSFVNDTSITSTMISVPGIFQGDPRDNETELLACQVQYGYTYASTTTYGANPRVYVRIVEPSTDNMTSPCANTCDKYGSTSVYCVFNGTQPTPTGQCMSASLIANEVYATRSWTLLSVLIVDAGLGALGAMLMSTYYSSYLLATVGCSFTQIMNFVDQINYATDIYRKIFSGIVDMRLIFFKALAITAMCAPKKSAIGATPPTLYREIDYSLMLCPSQCSTYTYVSNNTNVFTDPSVLDTIEAYNIDLTYIYWVISMPLSCFDTSMLDGVRYVRGALYNIPDDESNDDLVMAGGSTYCTDVGTAINILLFVNNKTIPQIADLAITNGSQYQVSLAGVSTIGWWLRL